MGPWWSCEKVLTLVPHHFPFPSSQRRRHQTGSLPHVGKYVESHVILWCIEVLNSKKKVSRGHANEAKMYDQHSYHLTYILIDLCAL
jgi:hypothetical protein